MNADPKYLVMSIVALLGGLLLWFGSSKERNENGEWSHGLQWAYLLILIGIFGLLATALNWSMTAVLLSFTLATGVIWLWRKAVAKKLPEYGDDNHFRDYLAGFFPIIAVIFLVRTFIVEPFQIPSSSMRPGLVKGDFILVNKFSYGIRVPVLNNVVIETGKVGRGDVAVFNYPVEPQTNYIKRIVGLPGDVVEYKDKVLTINGVVEHDTAAGMYEYADDYDNVALHSVERYHAVLGDKRFDVLKDPNSRPVEPATYNGVHDNMAQLGYGTGIHEQEQACEYAPDGSAFRCVVPQGKYFAMGDNRDNSTDSRYWGFVDDKLLVGKAFFIWLNLGELSRIGTIIR